GEAEADDRDERIGDGHEVEPPAPQPARAGRWRLCDTGLERCPDRARRTRAHAFRVGRAGAAFRAPSGVSVTAYPRRGPAARSQWVARAGAGPPPGRTTIVVRAGPGGHRHPDRRLGGTSGAPGSPSG